MCCSLSRTRPDTRQAYVSWSGMMSDGGQAQGAWIRSSIDCDRTSSSMAQHDVLRTRCRHLIAIVVATLFYVTRSSAAQGFSLVYLLFNNTAFFKEFPDLRSLLLFPIFAEHLVLHFRQAENCRTNINISICTNWIFLQLHRSICTTARTFLAAWPSG